MTERDLHRVQATLAGVPSRRAVLFAGQAFALRKPRLGPLLAFLAAGQPPPSQTHGVLTGDRPSAAVAIADQNRAYLAAAHQLLEESIRPADWPAFQETALYVRAGERDVQDMVQGIVAEQTAWKYWPAVRLLGFIAGTLTERDGDLLRHGQSLAALTPRQACNLAYSILLAAQKEEDDRNQFLDDLHYEGNPDAEAMALVRQMQLNKEAGGG